MNSVQKSKNKNYLIIPFNHVKKVLWTKKILKVKILSPRGIFLKYISYKR